MSGLYAYVDESIRGGRYLLCVVVVDPMRAGQLRRTVRHLLLPGQRKLHFKKESPRRRRELLVALAELEVDATVYECSSRMGREQGVARSLCMARVVRDLQDRGVAVALLIESRDGLDADDRTTIRSVRRAAPPLSFEHLLPNEDPLLWLPDCFAWPVGARGDWLRRARPLLTGGVVKVG